MVSLPSPVGIGSGVTAEVVGETTLLESPDGRRLAEQLLTLENTLGAHAAAALKLGQELADLRRETNSLTSRLSCCTPNTSQVSPSWILSPQDVPSSSMVLGKMMPERQMFRCQVPARRTKHKLYKRPEISFSSRSKEGFRLFADADQLKEQLRESLTEEPDDISYYYRRHGWAQRLARTQSFEIGAMILVCLNCVWMWIETDYNKEVHITQSDVSFQAITYMFCAFFCLELVVRLAAFKSLRDVLRFRLLLLDGLLVTVMVMDSWILPHAVGPTVQAPDYFMALRAFRLLKLLRLGRVLQELPELLVIIRGIGIAVQAIVVVLALLLCTVYIGALIFCQLLQGTSLGKSHFSTIPQSFLTLLVDCALSGARGSEVIRLACKMDSIFGIFCAALLLAFVLLANVTLMGVLAGLLVQTVRIVAEVEKEEVAVKRMNDVLDGLWRLVVDEEGEKRPADEFISLPELHMLMRRPQTLQVLQGMGVDLEGLCNIAAFVFELHDGQMAKSQFKRMVFDMRGSLSAKVKDHVETRKFLSSVITGAVSTLNKAARNPARGTTLSTATVPSSIDPVVEETPSAPVE